MSWLPKIFFIMWVSGSGKTTVLKESPLMHRNDIVYVPSWTTRPLRPWEVNGVKYHHVDESTFLAAKDAGEFLEYARVHNHFRYGTLSRDVQKVFHKKKHAIKELDIFWLRMLLDHHTLQGRIVSIFLHIPTDLMVQRINQRGLLDATELAERIASADHEIELANQRCTHMVDASQPLELVIETVISIVDHERQ